MISKNSIGKIILILLKVSLSATAMANLNFVNVKDFGAVGDGQNDDSAAIQKAIDSIQTSGGTVFFPIGRYRIKKTILLTGQPPSNNKDWGWIVLRGSGSGSFLLGDGVDYIIAAGKNPGAKSNYINGVRIKELSFSSFDIKKRSSGINLTYMLRWYIQDCNFQILQKGVYADGTRDADKKSKAIWIGRILNNIFSRNLNWSIDIGRCFDIVIANNVIEHGYGGICIGRPGDKYDAAANTVRIENNVIEGLCISSSRPAILGSCWIGGRIVGNYLEANGGGDICLMPGKEDGWSRGMVIASNTFQPTEKQRKDPAYGPLYLRKIKDAVIYGNFCTGKNLFHKKSESWGSGINIYSNTINNPASVGTLEGASGKEQAEYLKTLSKYGSHTQRLSVSGASGKIELDAKRGFTNNGRSISFGLLPSSGDPRKRECGDIIFNQAPESVGGKIILGWVCIKSGIPGEWQPIVIRK
jgi:hypothetical protein